MKTKPRRTGYSLFCMEKAQEDEMKNASRPDRLRLFGQLWRGLPAESKAEYRSRAASLQPPDSFSWKKKEWQRRASKMCALMDSMNQLIPTEGFMVLHIGGDIITHGTSQGKLFLGEYPGLATETFRAFLNGPRPSMPQTKVTVKTIQDLFNEKYSLARGIEGSRLPYVTENVILEGLPDGLTFKHPSKYGSRQLRAIFAAKDNIRCVIGGTVDSRDLVQSSS